MPLPSHSTPPCFAASGMKKRALCIWQIGHNRPEARMSGNPAPRSDLLSRPRRWRDRDNSIALEFRGPDIDLPQCPMRRGSSLLASSDGSFGARWRLEKGQRNMGVGRNPQRSLQGNRGVDRLDDRCGKFTKSFALACLRSRVGGRAILEKGSEHHSL